jgi:hypothetical protein
MNIVGSCPVCGIGVEADDTLEVALTNSSEPIKVCESCCTDIAGTLLGERKVSVKFEDGFVNVEVLS